MLSTGAAKLGGFEMDKLLSPPGYSGHYVS